MNQVELPTYASRKPDLEKVKTRILSILLDYPEGLTTNQITLRYIQRFQHVARIDNRLRELRASGEVESYPDYTGLLIWVLNKKKWKVKRREA